MGMTNDVPLDEAFNVEAAKKENLIGKAISGARRAMGMNQADLAYALSAFGISIKVTGISRWESGWSLPNTLQMIAVANILHMEDGFAQMAEGLAHPGRSLNEEGLKKLEEYRELLLLSDKYTNQ